MSLTKWKVQRYALSADLKHEVFMVGKIHSATHSFCDSTNTLGYGVAAVLRAWRLCSKKVGPPGFLASEFFRRPQRRPRPTWVFATRQKGESPTRVALLAIRQFRRFSTEPALKSAFISLGHERDEPFEKKRPLKRAGVKPNGARLYRRFFGGRDWQRGNIPQERQAKFNGVRDFLTQRKRKNRGSRSAVWESLRLAID